jgi:integrase
VVRRLCRASPDVPEERYLPFIGQKAITDISQVEMLNVLRKMEQRGVLDKLKKTRQACRQIFTYAIITGRAEHNPVSDLAARLSRPSNSTTHTF